MRAVAYLSFRLGREEEDQSGWVGGGGGAAGRGTKLVQDLV